MTYLMMMSCRIRVVGLDNLRNKDCEVIYIEAGIYHGGEVLGFEKFTSEVAWTSYPRWNQWLVFDIVVKNLPKAARLCLQVRNMHAHTHIHNLRQQQQLSLSLSLQVVGGNRTKDTKRKSLSRGSSRKSIGKEDKKGDGSLDKPLHWVNIQILDHRYVEINAHTHTYTHIHTHMHTQITTSSRSIASQPVAYCSRSCHWHLSNVSHGLHCHQPRWKQLSCALYRT